MYFYHLSYEDLNEMSLRRVWTLWGKIPDIWNLFWGGKHEKVDMDKAKVREMARKYKIKLPKNF